MLDEEEEMLDSLRGDGSSYNLEEILDVIYSSETWDPTYSMEMATLLIVPEAGFQLCFNSSEEGHMDIYDTPISNDKNPAHVHIYKHNITAVQGIKSIAKINITNLDIPIYRERKKKTEITFADIESRVYIGDGKKHILPFTQKTDLLLSNEQYKALAEWFNKETGGIKNWYNIILTWKRTKLYKDDIDNQRRRLEREKRDREQAERTLRKNSGKPKR